MTHRFDFMAVAGDERLAFDICTNLTETDVIRTFVKKLDTGVSACIICADERVAEGAKRLAKEYGLTLLDSNSVESAFEPRRLEAHSLGRRPAAA